MNTRKSMKEIAQAIILIIHFSDIEVAFLWYNLIAPAIVVVLAIALQFAIPERNKQRDAN